jgi:hypothetical protein
MVQDDMIALTGRVVLDSSRKDIGTHSNINILQTHEAKASTPNTE